jgi:hypothetical protein
LKLNSHQKENLSLVQQKSQKLLSSRQLKLIKDQRSTAKNKLRYLITFKNERKGRNKMNSKRAATKSR